VKACKRGNNDENLGGFMGTLFTVGFIGVLGVIALIDTISQRGKRDND